MSDSYSSSDHSYSGDAMSTWYWTDAGRERAQLEAIEEQRARTRRLERERRAGEAKLAEKISTAASQMNSRLDTLLRWTELRFQLLEFDECQARKEIRNTVRALAGGRMPVLRAVDDVPGYWLPPAAAAVLPLVVRDRFPGQGTAVSAFADLQAGLEAARERDAVRAELFSLAVGRCFDQPAFIDAAALRLLSEPADLGVAAPGQVARGWRTLWEEAATGAFGPAATAQIASLLREHFDPGALDEAALAEWDKAIEQFGPSRAESFAALEAHFSAALGTGERTAPADAPAPGIGDAPAAERGTTADPLRLGDAAPGHETDEADAPRSAVETQSNSDAASDPLRLGDTAATDALRLGEATPGREADEADAPLDVVGAQANAATAADPLRLGEAQSGHEADEPNAPLDAAGALDGAAIDRTAEPPKHDAAWRSYLQELIEEPSAAELPLVSEMTALNPAPEAREGDRRSWSDPAGTVADLVRRDLFDPEAPIPLRRIALGLAAPLLRERLDRIEASLGTTEKAVVTVRRRGEYIEVTSEGHDPDQFAAVERRIDQAFAAAAPSKPLSYGIAAALGVLGVLMIVLGQWFLGVLFALAVIIPLWKYRTDLAKATTSNHRRDEQLAETRAALVKARKDAENQERSGTESGLATRRGIERLRECLPAAATASAPGPAAPTAN
ncbi:hypothetical protein [Glycomyces tritici]|uniref:Uncharacterized protein n=1 Tax=Glycomyces tritici TaxID=2665176 RepID=A0ABT7YMA3_9ACTN|nr:hypothetical protein [Glycomyces tritici]MDN3239772.1 hypothetical protein [Glycomyces tritici]